MIKEKWLLLKGYNKKIMLIYNLAISLLYNVIVILRLKKG